MAKAFDQWTVLPHQAFEKLEDNLWRIEGMMPDGKTQRAMVVGRMQDGGLIIHNAIALAEPAMKELEAFGTPRVLVVPNGYHRMDARIWKQRYPDLRVVCAAGAKKRVEQVVPVDSTLEEPVGDDSVRVEQLEGVKQEGVMTVRTSERTSLVFCDMLLNMPKLGGPVGFFLAPTGRASVPRVMRWIGLTNRSAAVSQLERLADTPHLARILVGHGRTITERPNETLKSAARELAG